MTKSEIRNCSFIEASESSEDDFGLRHSGFIRHLSFVIRHL